MNTPPLPLPPPHPFPCRRAPKRATGCLLPLPPFKTVIRPKPPKTSKLPTKCCGRAKPPLPFRRPGAEKIAVDAYLDDSTGKMSDEANAIPLKLTTPFRRPRPIPNPASKTAKVKPKKPSPSCLSKAKRAGSHLTENEKAEAPFSQKGTGQTEAEKTAAQAPDPTQNTGTAEQPSAPAGQQNDADNGIAQAVVQQKAPASSKPKKRRKNCP